MNLKQIISSDVWNISEALPKFIVVNESDFSELLLSDRNFLKVIRGNKNEIRQYHINGIKLIRTQDIKKGTIKTIY